MPGSDDIMYMSRALELAKRGWGDTSPNPMVGAVLVKGGRIIAEGFHRRDGAPHAEIECLRSASESPEGATLYVTLEPCAMCSAALSLARVSRVVWGADDPMSGGMRGALNVIERARMNHRVEMTPGVLRADCERILKKFFEESPKMGVHFGTLCPNE